MGQSTRVECTCDDDCETPLRCVEPALAGDPKRCELVCPTRTAAWCSGAHYCGLAQDDLAGLAATDSVCIWPGE